MTDIELLPLPERGSRKSGYMRADMQTYARAVAEHNVSRERVRSQRLAETLREARDKLQAELDNRWAQGVHTCHENCQRIACVLRRDNKRLAEALRWYAEQAELCRKLGAAGDSGRRALDADGGKRARAALRDHDQEVVIHDP